MSPIGKHFRLKPRCEQEFEKEQDSIKSSWKKESHIYSHYSLSVFPYSSSKIPLGTLEMESLRLITSLL